MLMLGCLDMSNVVTVKENGGKVTVEAGPLNVTFSLRGTTCTKFQSTLGNNASLPWLVAPQLLREMGLIAETVD